MKIEILPREFIVCASLSDMNAGMGVLASPPDENSSTKDLAQELVCAPTERRQSSSQAFDNRAVVGARS